MFFFTNRDILYTAASPPTNQQFLRKQTWQSSYLSPNQSLDAQQEKMGNLGASPEPLRIKKERVKP